VGVCRNHSNLARHESVDLIVNSAESERRARVVLDKADALTDNVRFHPGSLIASGPATLDAFS